MRLTLFRKIYQRFLQYKKRYPLKLYIFSFIAIAHIFLLTFGLIYKPSITIKPVKKLAIKTYVLDAPKQIIAKNTQSVPKPTKAKITHTKPAKKIVKKTKPVKSKSKPAKKYVSTKSRVKKTTSQTQKLLKDMQESIAKIETNRDNCQLTKKVSVPKPIGELKTTSYKISSDDEKQTAFEYQDILTKVLKDHLSLPAYGKVKVKLTVESDGNISRLETVYSDSEVNRLYLEKNLIAVDLPKFVGDLAGAKSYCFSLIFCSDEH